MNKVIVLSGPTATGKSSWALRLAQKFNLEIVNFDSLLFYRELTIGTAKPSPQELASVSHHLVNIRSISQPMNAAEFAHEARAIIEEIHHRKLIPLLVGGSGFYLQALLAGMWDSPTTPQSVLEKSRALYAAQGITPFLDVLECYDPLAFRRLHPNDHYRIRRAVEHWWAHGVAFSKAQEAFHPLQQKSWNCLHLHLDLPKEEHLQIIRTRAEKMLEDGLVAEVQSLLAHGFTGQEKPLQAIGYKETLDWLRGIFGDRKDLFLERLIINTRRLAKSQRTWFSKKQKLSFNPLLDASGIVSQVQAFISQA